MIENWKKNKKQKTIKIKLKEIFVLTTTKPPWYVLRREFFVWMFMLVNG